MKYWRPFLPDAGLRGNLQKEATSLLNDMRARSSVVTVDRQPLVNPAMKGIRQQKLFNPRFEVDFDKGRDYDPDRERAEQRKDKRTFTKEQRGV